MGPRCQRNISFGRQPPSSCSSFSSAPRSPPPFNDFPRLGDRARWDSGHASHAHVCTCVYIVYIHVRMCIYTYTNARVYTATHPPGRSLILLRIFGWIEAKGEEMIPLSPSRPHLGHVPFTNKAGFSFFFSLRPISRVITNGDTRISLFGRRTACLRKFRDEALAICFYLSRENGVPGKEYCLLSNTKLFRNVICETDPEAISGKQYYRKKSEKLYFERVEIHVECIPQVDSHRVCKNHTVSIKVLDTHFFVYYICEANEKLFDSYTICIFLRLRNDTSFVFLTTAYVDHLVAKKFAQLLIEFRYRF